MSVAVAVKSGGEVVLAVDSKRTFGSGAVTPENLTDNKIRKVGSAYVATTGWGIYANILDDYLARKPRVRLTDNAGIFRFFTQLWKELRERYSLVNEQSGGEDSPFGDLDASFLIINRSGIHYVACDMSVTTFDQYCAIGSGGSYAMGALHAVYRPGGDATRMAARAVEAAMALDIYCGPPVRSVRIKLPKQR